MTTEPQTKKYRRIVTEQQVWDIASTVAMREADVRKVLEAAAEVVDGCLVSTGFHMRMRNGMTGFTPCTPEQFQQEWEEIPHD